MKAKLKTSITREGRTRPSKEDLSLAQYYSNKKSPAYFIIWACICALLVLSWEGAEIRPLELLRNSGNIATLAADFFPPDFTEYRVYLREIVVTLQIAIWGTFLSIVFAIPFALMSSSNIAPWYIVQPTRRLMDALRAINEFVFAMLFVAAVGLGPFAGVLAIFVHTTGTLAKLFSEAIESIDPEPVEGIRATGANLLEEISFGVIPQVMPLWVSYSLYRFESNVRAATVIGLVGAGGIGLILWENIRGFYFAETSAVLILIILAVTIVDMISARLRRMLT